MELYYLQRKILLVDRFQGVEAVIATTARFTHAL
jgi:hypothetical protein